jgi:pyruvate/2-oxoglutarate dehydrogenase complex dihydrolipoamide dehydrogenase (E3) component
VKVNQKNGKLILTCNRMELGEPDASGRRRPVPIKGSEYNVEYDTIIGAIGQVPEIPAGFKVKTARGNTITIDDATMATNRKGVWAGGDVVTGSANVIQAIAAGRKAASAIDKYLGGSGNIEEVLTNDRRIGMCAGITAEDFATQERVKMPHLPANKVVDNFTEVETGLTEAGVIAEGQRCFQCGFRSQITPAPRPPTKAKRTDVPV